MTFHWTSLADHVAAAEVLYGDDAATRLAAWLDGEMALVEDAGFAAEFAANAPLPGIPAGDYAHRLVRTARGELLGGIRFYGLDIAAYLDDDEATVAQ